MKKIKTWCPRCGAKNDSVLSLRTASPVSINMMFGKHRPMEIEAVCWICHTKYSFEAPKELVIDE